MWLAQQFEPSPLMILVTTRAQFSEKLLESAVYWLGAKRSSLISVLRDNLQSRFLFDPEAKRVFEKYHVDSAGPQLFRKTGERQTITTTRM